MLSSFMCLLSCRFPCHPPAEWLQRGTGVSLTLGPHRPAQPLRGHHLCLHHGAPGPVRRAADADWGDGSLWRHNQWSSTTYKDSARPHRSWSTCKEWGAAKVGWPPPEEHFNSHLWLYSMEIVFCYDPALSDCWKFYIYSDYLFNFIF